MAIFNEEGHCPSCAEFSNFIREGNCNQFTKVIYSILEVRTEMIVCDSVYFDWGETYSRITRILFGGSGALGIQLATLLQAAIPDPKVKRKILVQDVSSPKMMADDICCEKVNGKYWFAFYVDGQSELNNPVLYKDNRRLIRDDRFVVMVDTSANDIVIKILKVPLC